MRALGVVDFGGPEALRLVEKPPRRLLDDEVLIRVAASAVNPADLLIRSGFVAPMLAPFAKPYVLGLDAAGVVEQVGRGVTHLSVGDRVMACVNPFRHEGGGQNEQLIVRAAAVQPAPLGASFEEASTLMMNGATAWHALELAPRRSGYIAVTGGAGWLATIVLALARSRGLRTIADARPQEADEVRANGADVVIERSEDLARRIRDVAPDGVDAVIDTAVIGGRILPAIADGGVLVEVRPGGKATERGVRRELVSARAHGEDPSALAALRQLVVDGALQLRVAETFSVEQAAEAHRRQEAGGVRGRIVLQF